MNGGPAHRGAIIERLLLRMKARVLGQQGRMNVENAIGERLTERGPKQAHETRQADKLDAGHAQSFHESHVIRVARGIVAVSKYARLDPSGLGAREARCLWPVRDDEANAGRELAVLDRIDQRLQVRPAA